MKLTTETNVRLLFRGFALLLFCIFSLSLMADSNWTKFALSQSNSWYSSAAAKQVAENVLLYQKKSGGWPKNIEMHLEATDERIAEANQQTLSCFDNGATTTEMRFLAKMYSYVKDSRYREAFNRGLNCILEAQSLCGNGWPQYWPKRDSWSMRYSNFITFNDNLVVNLLKLLRDVANGTGDFADITESATRTKAQESYDKGVQCILECQIVDNGEPTVWCAQHDPQTLLPAVGRPHELPSFSGSESASILEFLMSFDQPSDAVKKAVVGAAKWFAKNKIENKKLENFTNANGEKDCRVVDANGQNLWARFTQIGGDIGNRTYQAFFQFLDENADRRFTVNGRTYVYKDADNARKTYDPSRENQPLYGVYNDNLPGYRYRFIYNYEDSDPVIDENGLPMPTSIAATNRTSYQFLGTWGDKVLKTYNAWKLKHGVTDDDYTQEKTYELSQLTCEGDDWNFGNGYSISTSKDYAEGKNETVKYSRNVTFTIQLPEGVKVTAVKFSGYSNYKESDAYVSQLGNQTFSETDYVFPRKDDAGNPVYATHTITLASPVAHVLPFVIKGQQACLTITLTLADDEPSTPTEVKAIQPQVGHSDNKKLVYDVWGKQVGYRFKALGQSKGNILIVGSKKILN